MSQTRESKWFAVMVTITITPVAIGKKKNLDYPIPSILEPEGFE